MISSDENFVGILWKKFFKWKTVAWRKISWYFLHANFFMFILLRSNHNYVFFSFSFLKNSLMQINSKFNSKPFDYLIQIAHHSVQLLLITVWLLLKSVHEMAAWFLLYNLSLAFNNLGFFKVTFPSSHLVKSSNTVSWSEFQSWISSPFSLNILIPGL